MFNQSGGYANNYLPIKHRLVIVAPLIEQIDLSPYLNPELINAVSVGGESGKYARPLDFDWALNLRDQCVNAGVSFNFHQTGSYPIKEGQQFHIPCDRHEDHSVARLRVDKRSLDHSTTNRFGAAVK